MLVLLIHHLDISSIVMSKHPEQAIYCQPYGTITSPFIVMQWGYRFNACGFYYSRVDVHREIMDEEKELNIIIWLSVIQVHSVTFCSVPSMF